VYSLLVTGRLDKATLCCSPIKQKHI